jgi:hypothetical protein
MVDFQVVEGYTFCIVCGKQFSLGLGRMYTCSEECHKKFVDHLVLVFGEFKKVVDAETGIAYKVPTRDIVEKGLRQQDLHTYPEWKE